MKYLFPCLLVLTCSAAQAKTENDYLIVPGERVGFITAQTSERELRKYVEPGQMKHDCFPVGEGFCMKGITLYPGTDDEIRIAWQGEEDQVFYDELTEHSFDKVHFETPVLVRIAGNPDAEIRQSGWHTAEGITIGTPLSILEKHNGKPLCFSGFGWDYGGRVDWNDGDISSSLGVDLVDVSSTPPGNESVDDSMIYGDGVTPCSDLPIFKTLNVVVSSMTVELYADK